MRYTGPKNRLSRREGLDLGLKTTGSKSQASLLRRLNIKPGQRPNARMGKLTEYAQQLREKQKLQRIYGLTEKQLRKNFEQANHMVGNTAFLLIQLLESRLDNAVFRLGFAPTRASARQLVNHGHFTVNAKKSSIPSYRVKVGDVIAFKNEKTSKIPYVAQLIALKDQVLPEWLEKKALSGKVKDTPSLDALKEGVDLQAVIEFYSR
ncbi:MAG: 30S ribosomal protein S4 [Microgenomates bacterium OLB23]|nr:MAG: 30S ribosomal protein S4 [Microgenomates bacterium OLB23]